jgi:hypothetical protein
MGLLKKCSRCKKNKILSEFYLQTASKDGYARHCIICAKEYKKENYQLNKATIIARNALVQKKHRAKAKIWYEALKESIPCADCKKKYPACVMDYHHLRDKKYNLAYMVKSGFSHQTILIEIDKCVLLCANCHRIRTHLKKD